jgi:transposase
MDTSAREYVTDKLGRRSGPRRKYTLSEKRAIVEETRVAGASVASVAQRHDINANLLFGWRRLHERGLLTDTPLPAARLLPVKVTTPTVVPVEQRKPATAAKDLERVTGALMEIEFAGGQRLRIRGRVDEISLRRVIALLSAR